ncbi:TIGR02302 family protein [Stappia stellulata]|uniref:TIGR02302 family protein n=1 Tax=Stappia stellulata TaxID=71235 RepID=UPI001AD93D94|nr:TIGR02302 family protein [Stappia stellulata]
MSEALPPDLNDDVAPRAGTDDAPRRLERALLQASASLWWERVWPTLQGVLIVAALYVGLSWLGLWTLLPAWLSLIVAFGFLATALWVARPLLAARWPGRAEALARVERISGFSHRPLAALDDRLFDAGDTPQTRALWLLHQRRARAALDALKAGTPRPEAFRKDPYALRALAAMLVVVGFFTASGVHWQRLLPVAPQADAAPAAPLRIDAWITPPVYTGRAPVFLTGASAGLRDSDQPVSVPEGSELIVRAQGVTDLDVRLVGTGGPTPMEAGPETPASVNLRHMLDASADLEIRNGGDLVNAWRIAIEPDAAPTIRLLDDPEEQFSGALKLSYLADDDHGLVSAAASIRPVRVLGLDRKEKTRPLVAAPEFPLSLAAGERKSGAGETIRDLTSHPWAGSEVELVLSARDHAGQAGYSTPHRFTLPQRRFSKPLARAIVEQRRDLALDANAQMRVVDAFDGLMLAPERFIDDAKTYLGMDFARTRLIAATTDDELREAVDLLWDLALTIEDGDLSLAERALRNAQEALRRALEEGASDEEIARLTQELREAMSEYFQALAEQMRQNPQAMQQMDPNAQSMRPQDLDEMLSRIEELAKTGSRDAARELLAQMQRMMENMQAGRPQMMQDGMTQEMMEALNELGEMIQRQQELMDQTHRFDQQQQNGGEQRPGQQRQQGQQQGQMTPEQLAEALRQLQQGQGELGRQLQQLLDQMAENGMPQNGELGRAGEEMGNARDSLGEGESGQALGQQGNALEALRQGAQGLAEQMLGQGQGPGMAGRQGNPQDEDPLGRPRRTEGPDFGARVQVPDEIDVQRARRILEELRKRFSDPGRPMLELDYLERLLRRY